MGTIQEKLYSNTGRVLKIVAIVIAILETVAGIFAGLHFLTEAPDYYDYYYYIAFALILGTPIVAYIISLVLYSFGELVENTKIIADNITSTKNQNTNNL